MTDILLGPWPLSTSIAVFGVAAVLTVFGAVRMAALGHSLAGRTGWGQALFGAIFFGATSSLSGIVVTAVAATADSPGLAYSNAVGGIAAQTLAIAVADFFYRRANLEHATASLSNILFGCLLVTLLLLVVLAAFVPSVTLRGISPMTVVLIGVYLGGLALIRQTGHTPMWEAVRTRATQVDESSDDDDERRRTRSVWLEFAAVGAIVAMGGAALATAAQGVVDATGLTAGFVGAVLLGVVNALPEAVTAIAAVRRGAVTLAVAAVLGGNCFDALNVAVGDLFYRQGSLYHQAGSDELFLTLASALMTIVVVGGLLVRQARGPVRVGFEGVTLIVTYLSILAVLGF